MVRQTPGGAREGLGPRRSVRVEYCHRGNIVSERMRALLILAAGALALGASRPVAAAPKPEGGRAAQVVDVRVSGNKRMTVNAILANVKTRVGHGYDKAIVLADQQRLLATGRFQSVLVQTTEADEGMIVTFEVIERPTISKLIFRGNKAFKTKDLAKELTFGVGSPQQHYTMEKGRADIRSKYRRQGFYFAKVNVDPAAFAERAEVIYTIVEGPRVRIRRLRIEGNRYFSNWRLRQEIATTARFWPFIPGYMDAEQVGRDVHAIRNLYVDEGFMDAEVGRKLDFSDDKKKVTLTFVIHEGPRYRISRILFKGNKAFSDEELAGRLGLSAQDFYMGAAVRQDVEKLQDTYGELGYIEAMVRAARKFKEAAGLVDLVFTIEESDQYRLGKIIIRGNVLTQSRVIRRELRFFPEQLFNTVAAKNSERRLLESRLFEKVTITPTGRQEGVRDALVQVKEGRTAEFLIGVGVSSTSGLLGNISLTQRNFDLFGWPRSWRDISEGRAWKGAGQTLRVSAEPGTEMMRFYIDWFEPYLFDRPYSLGTRAFVFTRNRRQYDETRYGGVVSFGHMFRNRWYAEVSSRVEGIDITDLAIDAPPEVRQVRGTHGIVGIRGSLTRNRTDSRWLPSTGDVLRFSYEQVAGDFEFGKAVAEYKIYRTLYEDALDRKHIISARAMAGHIFADAPVFEKFYGGGIGSVRGFEFRGISPRSSGTDDPIGGDFVAFVGAEYTFPLITDVIRGVVFLDTGTVEKDFEVTTWRAAAGIGVRWKIPFFGDVPLSFDFAFPISKSSEDDTQIFSFTIGWTF